MNTTAQEANASMAPEMQTLKARLKATWMSGDYGHFAQYLEPGALEFLKRLDLPKGTRMLDVACGAGQIAIPAARAGVKVTGIDIASNLIEQAKTRAGKDGLDVRFEEADAEALPYDDASFDVVVSLIGAMFAPRPDKVAAELVRVCRPGGRIVMANWTPEGHVGQMFKIIGKHAPPPPLMPSPMKWGDEAMVKDRLGVGTTAVDVRRMMYPMRYPFPPDQVVDFFFTYYGPTNRALASLQPEAQAALRDELVQLWTRNNKADGGSTHVEAEYLHVTATRA
jgi:2-polyprenyl-3-methyl-5-hydroxy-6-metoxy-1,4-benzoquinol methylase